MSTEKNEIDKLIKESLTSEDAKFYEELEEQNLMAKLGQAHKGKLGWLVRLMSVLHIVIFVLFIFCTVRFFNTGDTKELIQWAAAGFIAWGFMAMMKLFIWMQMDKNDVLRELKRIELQIAALSQKVD